MNDSNEAEYEKRKWLREQAECDAERLHEEWLTAAKRLQYAAIIVGIAALVFFILGIVDV